LVASFSVYSYAKLGARYPSRGGAAQFLIRCVGDGVISGGLNVFQFLGWVIAMALYAAGFAGYVRALLPWHTPEWSGKVIGIALIVAVVAVNLIGTKLVGRAETAVIAAELVILLAFVVLGLSKSHPARFDAGGGYGWLGVVFAAGLLFVTYEGFGVVTNSAGEMRNPGKQLPRAMYLALVIVVAVYVLVSAVVVMTLSLPEIEANQGHVLSEAGRAVLGQVGFVVIGVAALLATASGVNATMFGDANLAYLVATSGQMPKNFARNVWLGGTGGLFIARGSPSCSSCSSRCPQSARWPASRSCSSMPRFLPVTAGCGRKPGPTRCCWRSGWR
jgi:amino acid transporter